MKQTPRTEFAIALKALTSERGLDPEIIIDAINQAIVAAYRRDAKERGEEIEEIEHEATIDKVTGETRVFAWPVDKPEEKKDVTPPGFGRIAAQTAKQVIHQKIREAEKGAVMDEFSGRIGSLISGIILSFDGPNVRIDIGRVEAVMPASERIPNERLNPSQRNTFLIKDIEDTLRGKKIVLSRADSAFVEKLFAREVPEIGSGSVEIKGISRDPGVRTKIAVFSNQSGVDPVGSCVGQKGVRVQAVTNELGGERVDIIPWSEDTKEFIKASLAPVNVLGIKLNEDDNQVIVTVSEDELSLAIGKDGQNVRLASDLTGWTIEVEASEASKEQKKPKAKEENAAEKEESKSADTDESDENKTESDEK